MFFFSFCSPAHISCPRLLSKDLTTFLSDLVNGSDKEVFVSQDIKDIFFPPNFSSEDGATRLESRSSWVKEELEEGKDDSKEVFVEQLEDCQELSVEDTWQNGSIEDSTDDEDSDYEGPKMKGNKKRPKAKQTSFEKSKEGNHVHSITSPLKRKIRQDKFLCSVCEVYFRTKERMFNHVNKKHGPALPHECSFCLKTFGNSNQLKSHKHTVHRNGPLYQGPLPPPQCDLCSQTFTTRKRLNYHKSTAHKEKIPCEDCGKLYPAAYIKGHMKQAHTEKATCPICGKQVRALKDHMASVHTSDSEKQFHCEHCGKGFGNQRSLNDHMNIHLDIRPYACR